MVGWLVAKIIIMMMIMFVLLVCLLSCCLLLLFGSVSVSIYCLELTTNSVNVNSENLIFDQLINDNNNNNNDNDQPPTTNHFHITDQCLRCICAVRLID